MEEDRDPLQAFQQHLSGQCRLRRPKQRRKDQDNLKDQDEKVVVGLKFNRSFLLLIYTVLLLLLLYSKYQKLKNKK